MDRSLCNCLETKARLRLALTISSWLAFLGFSKGSPSWDYMAQIPGGSESPGMLIKMQMPRLLEQPFWIRFFREETCLYLQMYIILVHLTGNSSHQENTVNTIIDREKFSDFQLLLLITVFWRPLKSHDPVKSESWSSWTIAGTSGQTAGYMWTKSPGCYHWLCY